MNKLDLYYIAKAVDDLFDGRQYHHMSEEEAEKRLKMLERNPKTDKTESELLRENEELNELCQKYKIRADEYQVCVLPRATEKAKKAIEKKEFLSIRIETIEEIKAKNDKIEDLCNKNKQSQFEKNELRQEVENLQERTSALESELSVKENILKIKNMLCENEDAVGFLLPSEPISVAEQLINATYTREKGDMEKALHKAFGNNSDTVTENVYSVSELRQVAEHLLVYCNHNSEDCEQ